MLKYLLLLATIGIDQIISISENDLRDWKAFKSQYNKDFQGRASELSHLRTFLDNKKLVNEHNERFKLGKETYDMALNQYSDMTIKQIFGLNSLNASTSGERSVNVLESPGRKSLPEKVDWRQKGAVTPVKNQGNCGSCYSFSAVGSVESAWYMHSGHLLSLSEQQLVDCSTNEGNHGCQGGLMTNSFDHIKDVGGIQESKTYPYETKDSNGCRYDRNKAAAKITKYYNVKRGENNLKYSVAEVGVTSVGIHATNNFIHYRSGIFTDNTCSPRKLNHAVTCVGYDSENGQNYWIMKNSYGTNWGEKGYIRMARDKNNMCGVSSMASVPTSK